VAVDKLQILIEASDKASSTLASVQKSILGLAGAYLTFQTAQRVFQAAIDQIGQAIEAASQQEQADIRLANAVATLGGDTARLTAHLKDQASALQLTTTFTDDSIQAAQALLVSLGRLSGDGLDRATRAAVALAQGLGVDLESAATLLSKAAQGNTQQLARYGIVLDESLSKSQKFAAVLEFVEGRFGTLAEAMGSSFQGRLTQMNHQWGELQETLGNAIIKNQTVIELLHQVTLAIQGLNDGLAGTNLGERVSEITLSLVKLTDRVLVAVTAMSALFSYLRQAAFGMAAFAANLINPTTRLEAFGATLGQTAEIGDFTKLLRDLSNSFHDVATKVESTTSLLGLMKAELAQLELTGISPDDDQRIEDMRRAIAEMEGPAKSAGAALVIVGESAGMTAEEIKKLHDAIEGTDLAFTRIGPTVTTSADAAIDLMEKMAFLRKEIELSGVSAGPLVDQLNAMAAALEAIQVGEGFKIAPVLGEDQSVQLATLAEQWDALTERQQLSANAVADLGANLVAMGIQGQLTFENLAATVRNFVAQLIAAIIRMLILQAIARAFGSAFGGAAGGAAAGAVAGQVGGAIPGFGPSLSAPQFPITPNVSGLGTGAPSSGVTINQGFLGVSDAFVRDLTEAQSRVARSYGVSIVPLGSLA
jgi:hypothetical protein